MKVTKVYGKDFNSEGGALTLRHGEVTDGTSWTGEHTKTHDDGWTITGVVYGDYFIWVNEFTATHPKYGKVWGDFEKEVYADSEEGYQHFYKHHEPDGYNWSRLD